MPTLKFKVPIERHTDALPRFAVFPDKQIAAWKQTRTFVVDATLNGMPLGHRSMAFWKERVGWFIGITDPACKKVGVDTGDVCEFVLTLVEDFVPDELAALLKKDKAAAASWKAVSASGQRMQAMWVGEAKRAGTRAARAKKVVDGLQR